MFYSILYPSKEQHQTPRRETPPDCFQDLNLDRVILPILKREREYGIDSFFFTSICDPEILRYRQEVMRELEANQTLEAFTAFSSKAHTLGKYMDQLRLDMGGDGSWHSNYLVRGRMLECAGRYCDAIQELLTRVGDLKPRSQGLAGFIGYLDDYSKSQAFLSLRDAVQSLRRRFSKLEYCMLIKSGTIRVRKYEGQEDYSAKLLKTFEKFRQGDVRDYRQKLSEKPYAEHVEGEVLTLLSKLYPEEFQELSDFCDRFSHFDDGTILRFSCEIRFYLSWLCHIRYLKSQGLGFCYPKLAEDGESQYARDFFDLALAGKLGKSTVVNDFTLDAPERMIVITGPNQGGKTSFARAFGQLQYLSSIGVSVPGSSAALQPSDGILTHFGSQEDLSTLNGKLQDDLERLHELLLSATKRSVVIVNEIFASTTLKDALLLGGRMMEAFRRIGATCVVVTFLDELANWGPDTVSMMSGVLQSDPGKRSFKIMRKPPDGLAYALYIAQAHGLTYRQLSGRLKG